MADFGRVAMSHSMQHQSPGMPTRAQIGVLMLLSSTGPQTVKQISERFCMTSSAATQIAAGLETQKLIERTADKQDRRKSYLTLTKAGKAALETAGKERAKKMAEALEKVSDPDLEHLNRIMKTVTEHITTIWTSKQTNR
jgi:DNA-binding MarR family transcriptional regulator